MIPEQSAPAADDDLVRYTVTIIQPVGDFDRWCEVTREVDELFGRYIVAREVYQSFDDPNELLIHCEVQSERSAMAYLKEEVREQLDLAGIEIYPPAFAGREVTEFRIRPGEGAERWVEGGS